MAAGPLAVTSRGDGWVRGVARGGHGPVRRRPVATPGCGPSTRWPLRPRRPTRRGSGPDLGRVRRTGAADRAPPDRARGRPQAAAAGRPSPLRRTSGTGQDVPGRHRGRRDGRRTPDHRRAGAGAAGDLAALLTDLQEGDVLFIDEIHRLHPSVEEVLYAAMEDFKLDILIGKGPTARSIRLDLPRFTLIGATTRTGLVSGPLRDRFGFVGRLDLYDVDELEAIVVRSAGILGVPVEPEGARRIAERSRGTPRIANRLLRRVRDFVEVRAGGTITAPRRSRDSRYSASTASDWTRSTGPSSTCSAGGSPVGPSGSPLWPSASGSSRTRSRRPTSPTCSNRAWCSARHGAGWPPPGRGRTWD